MGFGEAPWPSSDIWFPTPSSQACTSRPTEWEHGRADECKRQRASFDPRKKQEMVLTYLSQLGPA